MSRKHGKQPAGETEDKNGGAENTDVTLSEKELEELKAKADERDEYYQKFLKVHAEYENTRKRMEKDKSESIKYANEGLVSELVPLMDNFDLALMAMDKSEDKEAVMDGIKMVAKGFHKVLEEYGVSKIKTENEVFDPNLHEAVMVVETDEFPEGTILEECRSGYTLKDRLLRPAQVKVARPVSGE